MITEFLWKTEYKLGDTFFGENEIVFLKLKLWRSKMLKGGWTRASVSVTARW